MSKLTKDERLDFTAKIKKELVSKGVIEDDPDDTTIYDIVQSMLEEVYEAYEYNG